MKKSTLLTTIAMIVVVVVALSTATYAWFSTATATTATASVTTKNDVDLIMMNGTVNKDTRVVTFRNADDEITLNASLLNGLYAPYNEITATISGGSTTGNPTLQSEMKFFTASTTADGDKVTTAEAKEGGTTYKAEPNVIRVVLGQAKDAVQDLKLTIYVDTKEATVSEKNAYAAMGLSFYVGVKGGVNTISDTSFTNGYNHANTDSIAENTVAPTAESKGATTGLTKPSTYANAASYNSWLTADEALKIVTEGNKYIKYEITLGTVQNAGDGCNLVIYTWLDGYDVETNAVSAALQVTYAFTIAPHTAG